MAKASSVAREVKRQRTVQKYAARRAAIKAVLRDSGATQEEKPDARLALQELPRDASPIRLRNRCARTGRPRGYLRRFRLSRIAFRELALRGEIPGVIKASW